MLLEETKRYSSFGCVEALGYQLGEKQDKGRTVSIVKREP